MPNKDGHRRFGNVRKLPSGRYQIRYPGPDSRVRTGPETYSRKSDAERALVLVEAQITTGDWTDPDRGKIKLADYADAWITERPGLRPRSVDNYRWLLKRYITPHLDGVPISKLSTALIRQWRATLISEGVSVSMAAKAYRLLRAVLMTAAEDDKILPRNPCRIRGAGDEKPAERPVIIVAQVFELAERVGRRPIGNIRTLPSGGYRLRFAQQGEMRAAPHVFATRAAAEHALYEMARKEEVDCNHDHRFAALVLLATFASLRWGEVIALRRCDLDLTAGTVRVRASYVERSSGEIQLGPPKSRAGRRIVGIPAVIIPALHEHLAVFVHAEPDALVFPAPKGGPLRRSNFNKLAAWPHAVRSIGAEGLHVHDLRHTGNTFAASSGAGLRDLMVRMGHDSERAALIYQHEARGADQRITDAIDAHVQAQRGKTNGDEGEADAPAPVG